jgi:prepilin-type N-terminal cleavage/methylation domain-containing protein
MPRGCCRRYTGRSRSADVDGDRPALIRRAPELTPQIRRAAGISPSRGSSGFTLIEIAVAVAVLAILSAILLATVAVQRGRSRISESQENLIELVRTLHSYDTSVTGFPRLLSHLTNEISTSGHNSCGSVYSSSNVTGWRSRGPFYSRDISVAVGMRIPIGLVRDTLSRIPATGSATSFGRLYIRIDSVALLDAQDLDERVDGFASPTSGTVTWTAVPDADGMLSSIFWSTPVAGC